MAEILEAGTWSRQYAIHICPRCDCLARYNRKDIKKMLPDIPPYVLCPECGYDIDCDDLRWVVEPPAPVLFAEQIDLVITRRTPVVEKSPAKTKLAPVRVVRLPWWRRLLHFFGRKNLADGPHFD